MELRDVIYEGPPIDDFDLLARLPEPYRELLNQINGFVQFFGGLHIRGICTEPHWHSLAQFWFGPHALSGLYPAIHPGDIPFGQDVLGDQFLLRDDVVYHLHGETGELESLGCDFLGFLEQAQDDPLDYLSLQPMVQFYNDGGRLQPGQLLSVYPPLCVKEANQGISLRAVSAIDRIGFLADFAHQLKSLPDGTHVHIQPERSNDTRSNVDAPQ
jgi:hypothetical protein